MENSENNYLLIAVVQSQDADDAFDALKERNFSVHRLPSVGAFLGNQNATFLIALPKSLQHIVLDALRETCRKRVEYIAVPLENAPFPLPNTTPVTVGGALVFGLDIELYEEI